MLRSLLCCGWCVIAGCGARWELVDPLVGECRRTFQFYRDGDGDGFGDPAASVAACEAGEVDGYTARNGVDCDDNDPAVTAGGVGTWCAAELVGAGWAHQLAGDGVELLWLLGEQAVGGAEGELLCEAWGGEGGALSSLAAVDLEASWAAVGAPAEAAFLVGGRWLGERGEGLAGSYVPGEERGGERTEGVWTGSWTGVAGALGWCAGEPDPSTAYPRHYPADPAYAAFWEEALPGLRLAVRSAGAGWCLDLPEHTEAQVGVVCERAAPDPADWVGVAVGADGAQPD